MSVSEVPHTYPAPTSPGTVQPSSMTPKGLQPVAVTLEPGSRDMQERPLETNSTEGSILSRERPPKPHALQTKVKNMEVYCGTLRQYGYEDRKHQHIVLTITHDLNLKIATSKAITHDDAFFCFFFSFSSFSFSISATYFSISSGFKIYQRKFTISPQVRWGGEPGTWGRRLKEQEGPACRHWPPSVTMDPGMLSDPFAGAWKEPVLKAPEPAQPPAPEIKAGLP